MFYYYIIPIVCVIIFLILYITRLKKPPIQPTDIKQAVIDVQANANRIQLFTNKEQFAINDCDKYIFTKENINNNDNNKCFLKFLLVNIYQIPENIFNNIIEKYKTITGTDIDNLTFNKSMLFLSLDGISKAYFIFYDDIKLAIFRYMLNFSTAFKLSDLFKSTSSSYKLLTQYYSKDSDIPADMKGKVRSGVYYLKYSNTDGKLDDNNTKNVDKDLDTELMKDILNETNISTGINFTITNFINYVNNEIAFINCAIIQPLKRVNLLDTYRLILILEVLNIFTYYILSDNNKETYLKNISNEIKSLKDKINNLNNETKQEIEMANDYFDELFD